MDSAGFVEDGTVGSVTSPGCCEVELGAVVAVGSTVVLSPGFVDEVEEVLDVGAVEEADVAELEDDGTAVVLGFVVVG